MSNHVLLFVEAILRFLIPHLLTMLEAIRNR